VNTVKYPPRKDGGLVEIQAWLDDPERFERYVKQEYIVIGGRLLSSVALRSVVK